MATLEALTNHITRDIETLKDRWAKCIELEGDYVEE